jgi:plastocyanin
MPTTRSRPTAVQSPPSAHDGRSTTSDYLDFAFHITSGRILDLCPCTRRAADAQYYRAHFHAVTPRQETVLANTHPTSAGAWVIYFFGPLGVGADWLGDAATWLGGQRPALAVTVDLGDYAVAPAEIHVARGTTVTWRNVDELGEAHTVTADPGQLFRFDSDFLEPDEKFSFIFSEHGRYVYYCRVHGDVGLNGMSGVVIVD